MIWTDYWPNSFESKWPGKLGAYITFLILRLGFKIDDSFCKNYLPHIHPKMYCALSEIERQSNESEDEYEVRAYKYQTAYISIEKNEKGTFNISSETYGLVHFLKDEIELKLKSKFQWKNHASNAYTTATDLSQFIFCPASFSIQSSIKTLSFELSKTGEEQHERVRLLNYIEPQKDIKQQWQIGSPVKREEFQLLKPYMDKENLDFFNDMAKSSLVFAGHHAASDKIVFTNELLKYKGVPDYVFKNQDGHNYIVEEKYRLDYTGEYRTFENHKIQLASYINYLSSLKATYGYLVYWYYQVQKFWGFTLLKCKVVRIDKNESSGALESAYSNLISFKETGTFSFNPDELNLKKCAKCSVNPYCGHKTGVFKALSYPYSKTFHQLKHVEYPEIHNEVAPPK